ncbi:MAG: hypothetical protein JXA49_04570 [Actinobacteria bacterium]|nr:hypothetical protein [Actinomycetota bacterium]
MKKHPAHENGFAVFELITLLLLLCLFLFGLVYLTRDASLSGSRVSEPSVDLEGERILNDLGAIFDQGCALLFERSREGIIDSAVDGSTEAITFSADSSRQVTLLADLDGDPGTGHVPVALLEDKRGSGLPESVDRYEAVSIQQESGSLTAKVYTGYKRGAERVTLSEFLDSGQQSPFEVKYYSGGKELWAGLSKDEPESGDLVDRIRVSVAVQNEGVSREVQRTYRLAHPVPCVVI